MSLHRKMDKMFGEMQDIHIFPSVIHIDKTRIFLNLQDLKVTCLIKRI